MTRGFFTTRLLTLAMLLLAPSPLRAVDYVWKPLAKNYNDNVPAYRWETPTSWAATDGKPGVPLTSNDTAVIPAGTLTAVDGDLGTARSWPKITVEAGGRIELNSETATPMTLRGGVLSGNWRNINYRGDLTISADSVVYKIPDDTDGACSNFYGKLNLPKAFTLTLDGDQRYYADSSTTCQGTLLIKRGTVFGWDARSAVNFGTAQIAISSGARFNYHEPWFPPPLEWIISNHITGSGTLQSGDGSSNKAITFAGNQLRPTSGTLAVHAGTVNFTKAGDRRAEIIIDVRGIGSDGEIDFGQIALMGALTDSLDDVDLHIEIDPKATAGELKDATLKVLTAESGLPAGPARKAFHSITIRQNGVDVKADVRWVADEFNAVSWVELSHIALPEGK